MGCIPTKKPADVCEMITEMLAAGARCKSKMAMRPGVLVRIASEPMDNGGTVVTFEDVTEKRQNENGSPSWRTTTR